MLRSAAALRRAGGARRSLARLKGAGSCRRTAVTVASRTLGLSEDQLAFQEMADDFGQEQLAPHAEEWRAGGKGQEELSAFVKAVLEDGELEDADIEQLLSRTGTPASGSSRPRSAGDADSSILPVYFEPAEGRGPSLRVQAHKARAVRSTKAAFQKHKKTQDKERELGAAQTKAGVLIRPGR